MPQSLAKIYLHLIFSTKHRERILSDEIRPELHAYMGGTLKGIGCIPLEINTEPDHAHVLYLMSRTHSVSEVIGGLKKSSTDWLQKQDPRYCEFHWQAGYGVFSVSSSNVGQVQNYIQNQQEHHREKSFQDEFRLFLEKYEVEYDERYVWD